MSSQSLASTLQLLPASTKAVVASAFVGLGVELVYKARNPALCFTYREPIDADVFEVRPACTRVQRSLNRRACDMHAPNE